MVLLAKATIFKGKNHSPDDDDDDDDDDGTTSAAATISRVATIPCPIPFRRTGSGTGWDGLFQRDF